MRHGHKAQNTPSPNKVDIQLLLNRVSIHAAPLLQTQGGNKCKKHMHSPNPFSFPPGTCFCPHRHQRLLTAGRNEKQEIIQLENTLKTVCSRSHGFECLQDAGRGCKCTGRASVRPQELGAQCVPARYTGYFSNAFIEI